MKRQKKINTIELQTISSRDTFKQKHIAIGIDVDGVISECGILLEIITNNWKGKIYIITLRNDMESTIKYLTEQKIKYNEIISVKTLQEKSKVIKDKNIKIFIDDQPETITDVPEDVKVLLVRNGGNFDFDKKLWIFSKQTARLI